MGYASTNAAADLPNLANIVVDKGTSVSGHPLAHISDQITRLESKIFQTYHVIPRS